MKEQNAFETLKNTLEDKYIRRKVVKITQYAFGHKVTLDKPIKVKNNLVTSWYFLNIMAYDVRLGDTMRFELTRKGLYFAGIDLGTAVRGPFGNTVRTGGRKMKETLSIGGKDEFKVIEVPSPFPPGIKTEIKKIMDERHMSDKEKHRLLISMANDLDKSIKWNDAENHLVDDVEELKRVALYGKIFMCIVCLFIVKLIFFSN